MAGIRLARNDEGEVDALAVEIKRLYRLKSEKEQIEAHYRHQEERVAKTLEAYGQTTAVRNTPLGKVKATLVKRHTTKINEVTLKKALGAQIWKKVTKTVLDKAKLEDLVGDGAIDPTLVAAHATIEASKPYIRLSAVEEDAGTDAT